MSHWIKRWVRRLLKGTHLLLPEIIKRPLRGWYHRRVFQRWFAESVPAARTTASPTESNFVQQPATVRFQDRRPSMRPTIICFPIIDWYFRFQRPQQLLIRLAARGYRVLYIDPSLDGNPYVPNGTDLDRWTFAYTENVLGVKSPLSIGAQMYQAALREDDAEKLAEAFWRLFNELHVGDATLFVELPFWEPLVRRLRKDLGAAVVYDCLDEIGGFANVGAEIIHREERLLREADLVLVSARALEAKAAPLARQLVYLPNGCDAAHFAEAEPHADLAQLPRPIFGYFGAIDDWFEPAWIQALALARPDASIVLIGRASTANQDVLRPFPNVHMLGEQSYASLPQYLAGFDVCLIPFRRLPLTEATNPVKMFEYLSAGKPVVSVRLPEVEAYSDVVACAENAEQFVSLAQAAFDAPWSKAARRQHVAEANSWDRRAAALADAIAKTVPFTSIIVVTYNNWDYTRLCLDNLYRHSPLGTFEVIVVDNASNDATRLGLYGYQCQHGNLRVIYNTENRGFAAANNQGLRLARGEMLVLLNNDALVTPGWLRGFACVLEDPGIGLVGPVSNHVANWACLRSDYQELSGMLAFARTVRRRDAGRLFDIDMLAMYCVALRRDVFQQIGELDERFRVGMFEDDDYAIRVRQAGKRVVCVEDVFVHHFGSASFGKIDREMYERIFADNRARLEEKWGIAWTAPLMRPEFYQRAA